MEIEPMRKRTMDLMQDCLAVLESAEIEDIDALIGQLRAEISLYAAKAAVRDAFEKGGCERAQEQAGEQKGTQAREGFQADRNTFGAVVSGLSASSDSPSRVIATRLPTKMVASLLSLTRTAGFGEKPAWRELFCASKLLRCGDSPPRTMECIPAVPNTEAPQHIPAVQQHTPAVHHIPAV
jgi:hypothetical protein